MKYLYLTFLLSVSAAAEVTFDWVTVPGTRLSADASQNQTNQVPYRISRHETTMEQWFEFLNAKAPSDPNGLFFDFSGQLPSDYAITRTGVSGEYQYQLDSNRADWPAFGIRRKDAMRFVNWMHNGKGDGDTESGVYDMSAANPTRAGGAKFFLPDHLEWLTAAHGDSGHEGRFGYQYFHEFPYGSDSAPNPGSLNFGRSPFQFEQWFDSVNSNASSVGFYGLRNAGGNVAEWIETPHTPDPATYGVVMGGAVTYSSDAMAWYYANSAPSSTRFDIRASLTSRNQNYGFRLAGIVPATVVNAAERIFTALPGDPLNLFPTGSFSGNNLTYQWYLGEPGDESQPVQGATASNYEIASATDDAVYWRRASNALGNADSEAVRVTVVRPYPAQGDDNIITFASEGLANWPSEVRKYENGGQTYILWNQNGLLYSIPFSGGDRVELTAGVGGASVAAANYQNPFPNSTDSLYERSWTAAGSNVFFVSGNEIFKVPLAGGAPTSLVSGFPVSHVRVAPDGSNVYFESGQSLYRVSSSGGAPAMLVNAASLKVGRFLLSPDGARLVFQAVSASNFRDQAVFSIAAVGGTAIRLSNPNVLPNSGSRLIQRIYVNGSSTRVLYIGDDDTDNAYRLYSAPIATAGQRVNIEPTSSYVGEVTFSPDGSRIAYQASFPGENTSAFSAAVNGGSKTRHGNSAEMSSTGFSRPMYFSPDGSSLVAEGEYTSERSIELFGFAYGREMPFRWLGASNVGTLLVDPPTDGNTRYFDYGITPVTGKFLYSRVEGVSTPSDFYSVHLDGSGRGKIDNTIFNGRIGNNELGRRYEHSEDGTRIVFGKYGDRSVHLDLYSTGVSDGIVRRLTPHLTTHNSQIRSFGAIGDADSAWLVWNREGFSDYGLYISRKPAPTPPVFVTQPLSVTINQNETATFTAETEGTGPISYQWYMGDSGDVSNPVSGAVSASYTTPSLTGVTHRYWVRATNPVGAADSSTAQVTLTQPPSFSVQPQGASVLEGNAAGLSVVAAGDGMLSYQWYQGATGDVSNPVGENSAEFSFAPVVADMSFWVRASSIYGVADSDAAAVTMIPRIPVFTSEASATATVGNLFAIRMQSTNGPNIYSMEGSPDWLQLDPSTGWLTGAPSETGVITLSITATNAYRASTSEFELTVLPPRPVITGPLAFSGRQNDPFSYQILASQSPTSFSATGLPDGLVFSSTTGIISGTPQVNGVFNVTVGATNAGGTGAAFLVLTIAPPIPPPGIQSPRFAAGYVNQPFSVQVSASNSPTSYGITGSPAWLSLSPSGLLSGTPTSAGNFTFQVRAANQSGPGAYREVSLRIEPHPDSPRITSLQEVRGRQGDEFTFGMETNVPADLFHVVSGSIPPGINFVEGTGLFSGTPTAKGTYNLAVSAENSFGPGVVVPLRFIIGAPRMVPVITSPASYEGSIGLAFSRTMVATGSPDSFTFTGLPAWLTQSGTGGTLTGMPTAAGVYGFSVYATNEDGEGAPVDISVVVDYAEGSPGITPPPSGYTAYVGLPFSVVVSSEPASTSMSVSGLPPGLEFDAASFAIGGTPSETGEYEVAVDSANELGTGRPAVLPIRVLPTPGTPVVTSSRSETAFGLTPYSYRISAESEIPVLGYVASQLPDWLTLDPGTGVLSGTPDVIGEVGITVAAYNAAGLGDAITVTLNILPGSNVPKITSAPSAQAFVGIPFSYQASADNGPIGAYQADGLPEGLTLDSVTGLISGRPLAPGRVTVSLSATNVNGSSPVQPLTLSIESPEGAPILLLPDFVFFYQTQGFQMEPQVEGMGEKPWSGGDGVFAEQLPRGMSLNPSTGTLSGKPLVSSDWTDFEVRLYPVRDGKRGKTKTMKLRFFTAPSTRPIIYGPRSLTTRENGTLDFSISFNSGSYSRTEFDVFREKGRLYFTRNDNRHRVPAAQIGLPGRYSYGLAVERRYSGGFNGSYRWGFLSGLPLRIDPASGSPVIDSPDVIFAEAGSSMSGKFLSASASPGSYSASFDFGLPPGVNFNKATGEFTGIPSLPGAYPFLARAKNGIGWSLPKFTTLVVVPAASPEPIAEFSRFAAHDEVGAEAPLCGKVGELFSHQASAPGGATYWVMRDLPAGLGYSASTGEISGLPELPGDFTVFARPYQGTAAGAEIEIGLCIDPADGAPVVAPNQVFHGVVGQEISGSLVAAGGAGFNPLGAPEFLIVDPVTGALSGTPVAPGTYEFTVRAYNSSGDSLAEGVVLEIAAAGGTPAVSVDGEMPAARVGEAFTMSLAASPATDFYDAGELPYGLDLDPETGVLSGVPLVPGEQVLRFWGVNAMGQGNAIEVQLNIEGAAGTPVIQNPAITRGVTGRAVNLQILASPSATSFRLSPVPAGLDFDETTGVLDGMAAEGEWSFVVSAGNALGEGTTRSLTLKVFGAASLAWLDEKFGDDAGNPAISGWDADPAKDGVANALKYALGLEPLTPAHGLMPAPVREEIGEDVYFVFSIPRDPDAADVTLTPQIGSALTTDAWFSGPPHLVVIENSPSMLKVRDGKPIGDNPKRFFRLKAEVSPPP